ncbi:MAG TPA: hypothetical protein VE397_09255 [Stellaceae bacterium]|nr:hypothetical protein [Stellaceae bacterium]
MRRRHSIAAAMAGAAAACALAQCAPPSREFQEAYARCRAVQPGMTLAEVQRLCDVVRQYPSAPVDLALAAVSPTRGAAGPETRYWYRYDAPFLIGDIYVYVDARGVVTTVVD